MRLRDERGEGKLANLIWLVVVIAVVYAGWHLIPVYFANYSFKDKMLEICRTPPPAKDDKLMDMLVKEAREEDLGDYIGRNTCSIQTQDTSRRIICEYDREAEILPGWKRVIHFVNDVEQPLVF